MHYELYTRISDSQSEKIMLALLDRRLPFVEICLAGEEADAFEIAAGRELPLVMYGGRIIGGFSDLANHLCRRRTRLVEMRVTVV